jgi:hypothetical protein
VKSKGTVIFPVFISANNQGAVDYMEGLSTDGSVSYLNDFSELQQLVNSLAPQIACRTAIPSSSPSLKPTPLPTPLPTQLPTAIPTKLPTKKPTAIPTKLPTKEPTVEPTSLPSTTQGPSACVGKVNVCLALDMSGSVCSPDFNNPQLCEECPGA